MRVFAVLPALVCHACILVSGLRMSVASSSPYYIGFLKM
jgi:hypothetical protein